MNSETSKTNPRVREIGHLMRKDILGEEIDQNTRLKLKINNLLWEESPKDRTIEQADVLACEIFRLLTGLPS